MCSLDNYAVVKEILVIKSGIEEIERSAIGMKFVNNMVDFSFQDWYHLTL